MTITNYNFTPEQLQQLKASFDMIDSNKNGYLCPEELNRFMTASNLDTRFLKAIYRVFDKNNDNQLSFAEFQEYLKACLINSQDPRYLFHLIFENIDKDHNGALDLDEIIEFGDLCGMPMSREDAQKELKLLDSNQNGQIEFPEICRAFGI